MPSILSSLLHRTRASILVLLLVVLPLQSVAQLVAGLQGHRHVHTDATSASSSPLRLLLDQLHAAQDPRLQAPRLAWVVSQGRAGEMHAHGGVFHQHAHDDADVLDVGDPADDVGQGGATAFLAWLPANLAVQAEPGSDRPGMTELDWRDRVVVPLLAPPRG